MKTAQRTALLLSLNLSVSSLSTEASFSLFDRFRVSCPASFDAIQSFDVSLVGGKDGDDDVWAAVYRSSNNMPSVLIKDEFLHAMRSATGAVSVGNDSEAIRAGNVDESSQLETSTPLKQNQPVAVARLRRSDFDNSGSYILDSMRCILKKENMDQSCDGGSEYNEAIAIAIDALLHQHLRSSMNDSDSADCPVFEGAIRTKATLFSSKVLEDRGFIPVSSLSRDMASHVSSLDACLEKFAERSVSTVAKNSGSRQRALEIVSLLGRLDRASEIEKAQQAQGNEPDQDEIDPWAGIKNII